jgi:hypothetical protein
MKSIPLRTEQPFRTLKIIEAVASQGANGIKLDEQRRRCRILDAIEKLPAEADTLVLEDADHAFLARLVAEFPFGVASPGLLAVIEEVIAAKETAAP